MGAGTMELKLLTRRSEYEWEIAPKGKMRVPAILFASEALVSAMDQKVYEQAVNVAMLPGIVGASYAMPDAHWGYGFPIGGVAAFDPDEGGVISAGGVGFDISCGVRCLHTGLKRADIVGVQRELANALYYRIPVGVGSTGMAHLAMSGTASRVGADVTSSRGDIVIEATLRVENGRGSGAVQLLEKGSHGVLDASGGAMRLAAGSAVIYGMT